MRTLLVFAGLLLAAACHAASARGGLVLLSAGDHYSVMRVGGPRLQEVVRLGGAPSYGESADEFVFLSNRSSEVGSWVVEIVDKKSHALIWSHPVSGNPVQMLQGSVKDVVVTARAVYFVTYPPGMAGGQFGLNVLSRVDGRQQMIPLPQDLGVSLSDDAGVPVLHRREGDELWKFNDASGAMERVEGGGGLQSLELGSADDVRETFRTAFRGAPAIGVVRGHGREHPQWTLAYVDPVKKTQLWEKPLPASVQPESVFVGPDGWDYYIDTQSGAVTGISAAPGTRELWRLPTDYLYDAHILEIDAE